MNINEINKVISSQRKELGLSISELSKLSGLSRPCINRIESGQPFSTSSMEKLFKVLNLSFEVFKLSVKNDDTNKYKTTYPSLIPGFTFDGGDVLFTLNEIDISE